MLSDDWRYLRGWHNHIIDVDEDKTVIWNYVEFTCIKKWRLMIDIICMIPGRLMINGNLVCDNGTFYELNILNKIITHGKHEYLIAEKRTRYRDRYDCDYDNKHHEAVCMLYETDCIQGFRHCALTRECREFKKKLLIKGLYDIKLRFY
jgi:hypothetical protein